MARHIIEAAARARRSERVMIMDETVETVNAARALGPLPPRALSSDDGESWLETSSPSDCRSGYGTSWYQHSLRGAEFARMALEFPDDTLQTFIHIALMEPLEKPRCAFTIWPTLHSLALDLGMPYVPLGALKGICDFTAGYTDFVASGVLGTCHDANQFHHALNWMRWVPPIIVTRAPSYRRGRVCDADEDTDDILEHSASEPRNKRQRRR